MSDQVDEPVPARMLNEVVYCPRLYALQHLHREWQHTADTVEGRSVHRRVDRPSQEDLAPADRPDEAPQPVRSLKLEDETLGMVAVLDLVEAVHGPDGWEAVPIDYKKSRAPKVEEGAWLPERVQVCAQALLLRAHGWRCSRGALYFAGSRKRVDVPITEELVAQTLAARDLARELATRADLPPPLVDSPKCDGCALVGVCLPDETNRLTGRGEQVRPLVPSRPDGLPLVVQLHGGRVGRSHGEIVATDVDRQEVGRARLADTCELVIYGDATVTTPLLRALAEEDVPVGYHTRSGWYVGSFVPASGRGAYVRIAQHKVAADPPGALALARSLVHSKIQNQRTLLRRRGRPPDTALDELARLARDAEQAADLGTLLGVEGAAARLYFQHFSTMLSVEAPFDFEGRNRRPPTDPVNALLSFAYACLARTFTHVLHRVGLDPYVGFLHQPRHGRPALALDLMEEFRPVVADSAVIHALNNGELQAEAFIVRGGACALTDAGRRAFVQALERRLDVLTTHPLFDTRLSTRRIFELQARLLSRVLLGELERFPEFRVR